MYSSWDKIPPRGDKKISDKELWISINYIQNNMKKVFLEIRKHNLRNMKNSVLPIIQFDLLWKSRGRILLLCVSQVIFLASGKWRVACLSFVASHHTAPNILFAANPNISFFQIKYVFHMIKASFVLKQDLWNL